MGERKGVNKYYPPDYDPSKGGLNKFLGTHALRERARKLHMGILIIRFEMPYNIWCEGCENHIGTGVRYNAEKKKVGMYYSTPIYQFRMKCHLCDNHFEIKTDPANLDYVIVSGARRQERRWDPTENEQVVPEDKQVTRKMATDAMFKLEHGVGDKEKSKEVEGALQALQDFQSSRWEDDYSANRALRESMRVKRVKEKVQAAKDASYNLSVPLLAPDDNDTKTAKLLQFTQTKTSNQLQKEKREIIDAQSVFARLKTKPVSPVVKKAIARQSLEGIVSNSQKNFASFKNNRKPQNLGIIHKKNDSETRNDLSKDASLENNTGDSNGNSRRLDHQNDCSTNASAELLPQTSSSSMSPANSEIYPSSSSDLVNSRSISSTTEESSKGDRHMEDEPSKTEFQKVSVTANAIQSLVGYDCSDSD